MYEEAEEGGLRIDVVGCVWCVQQAEQEEAEEDDMGDELRGLQIELAEQVRCVGCREGV